MLKSTFAMLVVGGFTMSPAFGDDMMMSASMMKCDDASMMSMQKKIDADTDPMMKKQVDMANSEMKMAMAAMHAKKMKTCATHLNKAQKNFMMKPAT